MRSAIRFTQGNSHFWNRCFAVRVQQFSAMSNYSTVLLSRSGQEAGHVYQRNDGNIEGVAKTNETSCFTRRINVEHSREIFGLVRHDSYRLSIEAGKSHDNIFRVIGMYL